MKRVNIIYGGHQYSVGRVDFDDVKAAIDDAVKSGEFRWISVNSGEGRPQPAELLVGPGIPISLVPMPDEPV